MIANIGKSIIQKFHDFAYMIGYIGKLITASFLFVSRGKTSR